tara:strand:+ start:2194 stop:3036 length:843 start_codon:yes stop_codon:yes gene_type:complete
MARVESAVSQSAIILVSVVAHFLWQYAANEGKVSSSTRDLFTHAASSLSILISFFLGVQYGQTSTKRADALAIRVQLDGAKYFLVKRKVWLRQTGGYHPFYFLDPIFSQNEKGGGTEIQETRNALNGILEEFPNFDAFSYFNNIAGLLGQLHALARVHTETVTFNRLFRGIVLIAYTVAIPLSSTIIAGDNGFLQWQFYITVLVNILILVVYFSIDHSQTHSIKQLADLSMEANYWRLDDIAWIPHLENDPAVTPLHTDVTHSTKVSIGGTQRRRRHPLS